MSTEKRSLTFFVLFFACFEIAVVIFDHNYDEGRKAEYEKKRAKEKNREELKNLQDVIV